MAEPNKSKTVPRPTGFSAQFWEAGKEGKFLIQRDPESGKYQFFPRPVAVWGRRRVPEWAEAKGTGTLISVTHSSMAGAGFEAEAPYYLAIAKLDEGPRVFAQMAKTTDAPRIGDRVRIVWDRYDGEFAMFKFEPIDAASSAKRETKQRSR
jgi:uncharacterized OB-fold protein